MNKALRAAALRYAKRVVAKEVRIYQPQITALLFAAYGAGSRRATRKNKS